MTTEEILNITKSAEADIKNAPADEKNKMLKNMAECLKESADEILSENEKDIKAATGVISDVMTDRLRLTNERISAMADGICAISELSDEVNTDISVTRRPNGLVIHKKRVPLGLVAIIYESRPNVTSDAAALALKSGNACVLRCGKEAHRSAKAIVSALKEGIKRSGMNPDIVNLVDDTSRDSANYLMTAVGKVDLLIPRGGKGLISACVNNATVPCIQTGTGICHVFVDESADLLMAADIIENAKTSRPSVCNAEEVCLVHEAVAKEFLPMLKKRLVDDRIAFGKVPVELRLCEKSRAIIDGKAAGENDFDTEFLDYILAVKTVGSVSEAASHVMRHSTGHSEAIITRDDEAAKYFADNTDSAAVYINASTRFTDGGEFGMGCEMGISTQKLHARGPMGLNELTTYKYIIEGTGQIR